MHARRRHPIPAVLTTGRIGALLAAGALGAACAGAAIEVASAHEGHPVAGVAQVDPRGESTLNQRLLGPNPADGWAVLRSGPGEGYVVREELADAQSGRENRRRSLVYLAQLSDFQIADPESPARVEFLDPLASSAWRPQETLVPHQVEYTIRQVNRYLESPVPQGNGEHAELLNAVLTGDQADNAQLNEAEWVIRLMQGGPIDPASGTQDLNHPLCPQVNAETLIQDYDDPRRYTGIQDYDDYLVPRPGMWDPEDPRGVYLQRGWPIYPNLMDRAQDPFTAVGLDVPSYVAFGNHDLLVQGNEDANAAFDRVVTGCVKAMSGSPQDVAENPNLLVDALADPNKFMLVPRDERRRFVDPREFKDLHDNGFQEDEHGFAHVDPAELAASDGAAAYYSFAPADGIRYIVLDSVSTGGVFPSSASGNIDDPQFQWLTRELHAARGRNELVLVFAHHVGSSLSSNVPDELAPPCLAEGRDPNPGCDRDPRSSMPIRLEADLDGLLHQFPNVIALVGGHSHENRVRHRQREGAGYWEIKSPAVVDWPTQHRLIEVMDNRDGTLSIFGTMLDHGGDLVPPPSGTDARDMNLDQLVAIGRTLAYNDPQVGPGPTVGMDESQITGDPGPQGLARDRNVELLLQDPRPVEEPEPPDKDPPDRRDRDDEADEVPEETVDGAPTAGGPVATARGRLPFTGRDLLALVVIGLAAGGAGLLVRRRLAAG